MKVCPRCGRNKVNAEFSSGSCGKYGLSSWCIACMRAYQKAYQAKRAKTHIRTKTCSECGEIKPMTEFAKSHRTRDGRRYICNACQKVYYDQWKTTRRSVAKAEQEQPRNIFTRIAAWASGWVL